MSFAKSVQANSKKALMRVNAACYKIAKELFSYTVQLTPSPSHPGPYAIGHLANQWYPEVGKYFSEELSSDTSATGADSMRRINAMYGTAFFGKDGALTLTNNLHYAYRAEALGWPKNEGWTGTIGPYRMVFKSIQLVAAKYK